MEVKKKSSSGKLGVNAIISIILLSIFAIFILQNTEVVEIRLLFWEINLSRVVLLLGSLFIGVLIGLLVGWEMAVKKKPRW